MLLIGSRALKKNTPDLLKREPKDLDFIGHYDEIQRFIKSSTNKITSYPDGPNKIIMKTKENIFELEIAWTGSSASLILNDPNSSVPNLWSCDCDIATNNTLYWLKKSHRFLKNSPHFIKTMDDLILLGQCKDVDTKNAPTWFKQRELEVYNYTHPKLNVSKDEFFKKEGYDVYNHDTLHLAVKRLEIPAYEFFKAGEVLCDRKLFEKADEHVRLLAVLEEAYVLALERSQIPFPGVWSLKKSFEHALMKICTSITSGFFRTYAYDNYYKVLGMYEDDYVVRFNKALEAGIVKKL